MKPRRNPPRHLHHGRRPGERRLLHARARASARQEDREPGRPHRVPPLLRGRARQPRRRHHLLRVPGRAARAARAPAWCTGSSGGSRPRMRSPSGLARLARRGRRVPNVRTARLALRRPRRARPRARGRGDERRAAGRRCIRSSRRSLRSRGSTACAPTRREPDRSRRLLEEALAVRARRPQRLGGARRAARGSFYAYDAAPAERGVRRRRHRSPRRLGVDDGRPRGLARAGRRVRGAARRRSSTASGSTRSTSASRAASSSRSRRSARASRRTSRSSISASRSSCRPPSSTCASASSPMLTPLTRDRRRPRAPPVSSTSLTYRLRPRPASRPARSSCCTGAAPTRTTSSRCSTRSTPSAGSPASRRGGRCRCRRAVRTGTPSARSATRTPSPSSPTYGAPAWLDALPELTGVPIERTVIGGFSQGCVMSYALGLGRGPARTGRASSPSPGSCPPSRASSSTCERPGLPVAIGHGTHDPVIGVEWGRDARERLTAAGARRRPTGRAPIGHTIDPELRRRAQRLGRATRLQRLRASSRRRDRIRRRHGPVSTASSAPRGRPRSVDRDAETSSHPACARRRSWPRHGPCR